MKKAHLILFACILATSLLTSGCGKKYSDVKKLNGEFVTLTEKFTDDLDNVESAKDAAKAINRYADGMEALWPKMKKLSEKYPELENTDNLPEELREIQESAEEMGAKMMESMMKLMAYMQDPEVQKSQQRLQTLMSN